jgi:hypothetical protein
MARASAVNAVATAVLTATNVSSVRTLCQGGVSRNRHRKGAPPYVSIGPCSEEPDDALGTGYRSIVHVPLHVITSGEDVDGDSRASAIASALMALIDEPASLTVTGWAVRQVRWVSTRSEVVQFLDGAVGYDTEVSFDVSVRQE